MSANTRKFYPSRHKGQEVVKYSVLLEGAGTSVPTVLAGGEGLTVARTGVGVLTVTVDELLPVYRGAVTQLGADTAADIEDHSVVVSNMSSGVLTVSVFDGTPLADDLEANEYLYIEIEMQRIS